MGFLAVANFTPLFGAVLICWIFSTCIHEFSHALVAYLGGDKSVRDKGYLHFNVFAFIHPLYSILIPALFLLLGGLPLPGAAVHIDHSALRSRHWVSLVSLAGPASNFILFLILAALLHPATGLVDPDQDPQPTWAVVMGAMCVLELFSVLFNLIPIPPLDGYGIIEPYLDYENQLKMRSLGIGGLFIVYMLFRFDPVMEFFQDAIDLCLDSFGLPFETTWRAYNHALFGVSE